MKFSEALKEYLEARERLAFELSKSTPGRRARETIEEEIDDRAKQLDTFFSKGFICLAPGAATLAAEN